MITDTDGQQSLAEETIPKAGFKIDKFFKFNNKLMFKKYNKGKKF